MYCAETWNIDGMEIRWKEPYNQFLFDVVNSSSNRNTLNIQFRIFHLCQYNLFVILYCYTYEYKNSNLQNLLKKYIKYIFVRQQFQIFSGTIFDFLLVRRF